MALAKCIVCDDDTAIPIQSPTRRSLRPRREFFLHKDSVENGKMAKKIWWKTAKPPKKFGGKRQTPKLKQVENTDARVEHPYCLVGPRDGLID
ncbi:MAG: hypothetical protein K2H74_09025 [Paramuribaculum sp.]|nr:hypothetical protein [Paramuribaculum sp.]